VAQLDGAKVSSCQLDQSVAGQPLRDQVPIRDLL
jgi:hypothetical protein